MVGHLISKAEVKEIKEKKEAPEEPGTDIVNKIIHISDMWFDYKEVVTEEQEIKFDME